MRTLKLLLAASLSIAAGSASAQTDAVVDVVFTPQGRFFDAGETRFDIESTQTTLSKHFQALGKRWLAPGTKLRVEVTEIDLAGRIPPTRSDRPRVLTGGADWPRITLRYEFTRPGGEVERGDVTVKDMNYLSRMPSAYSGEALAHEKLMLEDWFRQRFAPAPG